MAPVLVLLPLDAVGEGEADELVEVLDVLEVCAVSRGLEVVPVAPLEVGV